MAEAVVEVEKRRGDDMWAGVCGLSSKPGGEIPTTELIDFEYAWNRRGPVWGNKLFCIRW